MRHLAASHVRKSEIGLILDWLLHEALDRTQADLANVRLIDWHTGFLEIRAQSGFTDEFLTLFARVSMAGRSACARALRRREPVVIEDIMADSEFESCRDVVRRQGIRAVQSVPMISNSGILIGIASAHFARPHRPASAELHDLKNAARLAANAIVGLRALQAAPIATSLDTIVRSRNLLWHADELLSRITSGEDR